MKSWNLRHDPTELRLFIGSFKLCLKAVLPPLLLVMQFSMTALLDSLTNMLKISGNFVAV